MGNRITVIDFAERAGSLYIEVEVFDAAQNSLHREEVRFLDDLLYGDLVHTSRSPLTEGCRKETVKYLKTYFNR